MDSHTFLSAPHGASPRLARRLKLNTIMEIEDKQYQWPVPPRMRRTSDVSPMSVHSRMSASTISSYYEGSRGSGMFEDLYDVSSESEGEGAPRINVKRASIGSTVSTSSMQSRNRYPALAIPSPRHWPTIDSFKKHSPVPPTPPSKIPISPEVLSRLPSGPAPSTTPSLDGSLSSDQQASISAPSTPDIICHPARNVDWGHVEIARASADFAEETGPTIEVGMDAIDLHDAGVQLPAEALDLLRHLSVEIPTEQANPPSTMFQEMQEVACVLRAPVDPEEPVSATSEYSLSELSIPSPGGFFSSLEGTSRHTWSTNLDSQLEPPSSTTAEHFYNAPWNAVPEKVVEATIEITDDQTTEGPPTARLVPFSPQRTPTTALLRSLPLVSPPIISPSLLSPELVSPFPIEVQQVLSLDDIDRQLREATQSSQSRTSQWAAAQSDFLHQLAGKESGSACSSDVESDCESPATSLSSSVGSPKVNVGKGKKKAVKFLDTERANAAARTEAEGGDSLFYHAFQTLSNQSSPTDSFIHRHSRFDAMQALRASLRHTHIDALLGHYATVDPVRTVSHRPISMMPGATERDAATAAAHEAIAQRERERQAFEQVAPAMWIVEAMRFLAGGKLLNSPAADVLAQAPPPPPLGHRAPPPTAVRVLDLGGQPQCDWAWHCAREYPHVRTYTATCDERAVNLALRGPRNHRLVRVERLFQLPFPDAYFDVVSARSLPQFLRAVPTSSSRASTAGAIGPDALARDEYDACLAECKRVLKPGGFLEFFVLDAELAQPGPRGSAASVEFAVNLQRCGYDPAPTRAWLRRVRGAGFVGIKRAWMFLPMGAIREPTAPLPETPPPPASPGAPIGKAVADFPLEGPRPVEAVQGPVGSASDAAHISGLVGSCLWERWMLRLQMEMGREVGLLDGVGAVIEEGRRSGAGWKCMSGWAQKPLGKGY